MPPKKTVSVFNSPGKYGFKMICPKCGAGVDSICECNIYKTDPESIDDLFVIKILPGEECSEPFRSNVDMQCLDCGFVGNQDLFVPQQIKDILNMQTMKKALE